jgi:hypothetical protein
MGKRPEAQHSPEGDRRAFFVVWGPEGGNPVVRFRTFEAAKQAAWRSSEKHPAQGFFVLRSCWGRLARPPESPAADLESREGGEGVERRACTVFTRAKATPTSNPTRKPTRNDRRTMASNATRSTLTDGDSIG